MFDWTDELEISYIIWGETGESDDHIVPYPDGSQEKSSGLFGDQTRKEQDEGAGKSKPDEQKKPPSMTGLCKVKFEGSSQHETNESLQVKELSVKSLSSTSLTNAAKTDQDDTRTEVSNNLTEDHSSRLGGIAQLDNSSETLQTQQNREQGDYVDYDWANVGSFDDLDRIFSNYDPISGHASLGNLDELWLSSKEITSSPEKSIPLSFDSTSLAGGALGSSLDQFEVKSEYVLDRDPFGPGYDKMSNVTSNISQDMQSCSDLVGSAGGNTKCLQKEKIASEATGKIPIFHEQLNAEVPSMPDKGNRKKRFLKPQTKSEEKREVRQLQDICGSWSRTESLLQEFDSHYVPTGQSYPPFVMGHQTQLLGPESTQYNNFTGPLLVSPMYANMSTQYPPMASLLQLPSGEGNNQKLITGYEVSPANSDPMNTPPYAPMQPIPMTPQEKINKLRRRQQMRAMLAIQKQQQQFNNQVSSNEPPFMEGGTSKVERNLYKLPSIDPSSPIEQDGSNTMCITPNDSSVEDSILHRLQDVIVKLDIRIRLCIRDSLFRLAQSAAQRQFSSDTSSTNRSGGDEIFNKEEGNSQNRLGRMLDVETETNPTDRTVAHLLFHRPLESFGKHIDTSGSPVATKLPHERNVADLMSLPGTLLPQSFGSKKPLAHDAANVFFLFSERDESIDTSENASNNEAAHGPVLGLEACQPE